MTTEKATETNEAAPRDEKVEKLTSKARESWTTVKSSGGEILELSADIVRDRAELVDLRVKKDPWPIVGSAFVVGLLLGFILGGKD